MDVSSFVALERRLLLQFIALEMAEGGWALVRHDGLDTCSST